MTDHYVLSQGKHLVSPPIFKGMGQIQLRPSMSKEEFDQLDEVMIAYFDNHDGIELPDILINPSFLVSTKVKHLCLIYEEEIPFKAVQLFSVKEDDRTAPLYWIADFPTYDCLHSSSEKFGNGMLKEMVLDQEKIGEKELFRVGGILENRIVISLAVAESLLRRELMGIGLEPVKVR